MQGPYIERIRMINIGPFEGPITLEAKNCLFWLIEAPNGEGKTTVLDSIPAVFENNGGAALINKKCDRAEIEISFTDGCVFHRELVRNGKSKGWCITPDGRKIDKETELKAYASGFSLDPGQLWELGKTPDGQRKRTEYLLKALNLSFQPDEIYAITKSRPDAAYTIKEFDQFLKTVEDQRTAANRVVDQNSGAVATLKKGLNLEDQKVDWEAEHRRLTKALLDLEKQIQKERGEVQASGPQKLTKITAERDKKLADLKLQYEKLVAQVREEAASEMNAAAAEERKQLEAIEEKYSKEKTRLIAEEAQAAVKAAQQQRAAGVQEEIEKIETTLRRDRTIASDLSEQIDQLRMLRKSKLDNFPVPDLDFVGDRIFYKGVDVDTQLNKAENILLWCKVGYELRKDGMLPFFISDYGDGLDNESLEWLKQACEDAGIQLLITRNDRVVKNPDNTRKKLRVTTKFNPELEDQVVEK